MTAARRAMKLTAHCPQCGRVWPGIIPGDNVRLAHAEGCDGLIEYGEPLDNDAKEAGDG